MELNYRIEGKHAGKFISFLILGVLHSLDKKLISIKEAEGFIFMPYVSKVLKKVKVSDALSDVDTIAEIIDAACELENVERIIPDTLSDSINELIEETLLVIKNSKKIGRGVHKEVKVIDRE
ncbi:DUF3969 family protein [Xenorhabdus sp. XENO-10]|uniref:DUF3969 family protein n=1 Tax=Xenorhabdus yunnanensis TaxID=3025878 RepID=A0ABT5LPG6_9GAMM|nr:DUF3969 family protein [Xenorhabdus yunnanensis]MDC9591704.1 DUF3969 family protein [Xenorhabdus yunnanensis]